MAAEAGPSHAGHGFCCFAQTAFRPQLQWKVVPGGFLPWLSATAQSLRAMRWGPVGRRGGLTGADVCICGEVLLVATSCQSYQVLPGQVVIVCPRSELPRDKRLRTLPRLHSQDSQVHARHTTRSASSLHKLAIRWPIAFGTCHRTYSRRSCGAALWMSGAGKVSIRHSVSGFSRPETGAQPPRC